jgi:hypothetical protein
MIAPEEKKEAPAITPLSYYRLKEALRILIQPFIEAVPFHKRIFCIKGAVEVLCAINFHKQFPSMNAQPTRLDERFAINILFGRDTRLYSTYAKIFDIFCDEEKQAEMFPQNNSFQIQTCIRELFYEELNPVKGLSPADLQQPFTELVSSVVLNLPSPIATIAHTYLDYKDCQQLNLTSHATHFFNKTQLNKPENILYMLGSDVIVSRKRGWGKGSVCIDSLNEIKDEAIHDSLPRQTPNPVKLFPSLYHVMEYAHHLQHGGDPIDRGNDELCLIPVIWAVHYRGNIAGLKLISEDLVMHKGLNSSCYAGSERRLTIIYGNAEKDSFLPLRGMVVYGPEKFADYKISKPVNYQKAVANLNTESGFQCVIS